MAKNSHRYLSGCSTRGRWVTVAALFGLPTALACHGSSPAAPVAVAGAYTLRSVDGLALPLPLLGTPARSNELVADTLVLAADGSLRRRQVIHSHQPPYPGFPGLDTVQVYSQTGSWAAAGSQITLRIAADTIGAGYTATASRTADGVLHAEIEFAYETPQPQTAVYAPGGS